uniref:Putative ovo n=1 Tax=Culex tarsalis TaxID=7177 RepID=A0A1Q3EZX3_CULTA
MRCVFPGCDNTATGPRTITFASVHAKNRLANLDKWKKVCGVTEFAKNASVCSDHFRDEDFINPNFKSQGLKPSAIPRRNPKAAAEDDEDTDPMEVDVKVEREDSSESEENVKEVVELPAPPVVTRRQGQAYRYVAEIDEDALECSPKVRRAFKVLKRTIRQDKARLAMYQKRNSRLREENQLLKKVLDEWEKEGRSPVEILERIVEDGLKKEEREEPLVRKFVPRTVRVGKRLTIAVLGKIRCRMCFGTRKGAADRSAFSSFAGEDFLSDIVETCFGIRIEEHDFCTKICEECLVKVDIAWKLYSEFQSNRLALKEFYRNLKEKKSNLEEVEQASSEQQDEEQEKDELLPSDDPESSDSDCYSLPDHPFFTEHTKALYLCHLCDQQFERSNSLDYHLYTNHQENDQDSLCQICAKFVHKRQIRKHVELHTEAKPVCPICNQTFQNPQNLARHRVVHTKERPYPCTLCDLRFTQAASLKQHVQRVHMAPERSAESSGKRSKYHRKPATCPVCFKDFKISRKLIEHVEQNHPEHQLEVFTCELCYKQFISEHLVRAHRAIWHPSKEFHCDRCGRTFPTIAMLGFHLKKHEKERNS